MEEEEYLESPRECSLRYLNMFDESQMFYSSFRDMMYNTSSYYFLDFKINKFDKKQEIIETPPASRSKETHALILSLNSIDFKRKNIKFSKRINRKSMTEEEIRLRKENKLNKKSVKKLNKDLNQYLNQY